MSGILHGPHRGITWTITPRETSGHRNDNILRLYRGDRCIKAAALDWYRYLGDPRFVQLEIDRLAAAGLIQADDLP